MSSAPYPALDYSALVPDPEVIEATSGGEVLALDVVGRQEPDGWKVALLLGAVAYSLTPAQARLLALELADHAALLERGWLP